MPVRDLSRGIEPNGLIAAADAVCALKEHEDCAVERLLELEQSVFGRGGLDVLVTTYRCTPEILSVLARASRDGSRLSNLLRHVGDGDVASLAGYPVAIANDDLRNTLSPREREVYELVIQRLTNREIAKLLFIEESTVKVHVHHIYDKLGVRSRLDLTVQATLERSGYATSAMAESAPDEDSS